MVDVVPVLLLVFGLVSVVEPGWIAAVHRRQKAAGTTLEPDDIDVTETWIGVTRVSGVGFVVLGLVLTFQSL